MNAPAPTTTPAPAPTSTPTTAFTPAVFLALSSGLTGVSTGRLQPATDALDVTPLFYAAIRDTVAPEVLDRLANTFLAASTVTEGAAEVLIDPALAPLGHNIIRLWLTGVWRHPGVSPRSTRVVSDEAYRQTPVWRIMQAHPTNDHPFGPGR